MTRADALRAAREMFGPAARAWTVRHPHCRPPKTRYYIGHRVPHGEVLADGAGDSWQQAFESALVATDPIPRGAYR